MSALNVVTSLSSMQLNYWNDATFNILELKIDFLQMIKKQTLRHFMTFRIKQRKTKSDNNIGNNGLK